jgi:O-antigen/teichoic acid export membrane protein
MNTVQRVAKNTAVMLTAHVLSYVAGFFSVMFTARYLGAENFGVLSFALAFTGIFAILADLGVGTLSTREIARDKSLTDRYLRNISLIKAISVAATFALIALTINLMNYPQQTITVVYLAGLALVITAFSGIFYSIFVGHERMEYQSLGLFLNSVALLVGVVLAIRFELGVVGFAMLWGFASAIVLLYCIAVYRLRFARSQTEKVTARAGIDWSFSKSLVKAALPLLVASVFGMIAHRIDMVMLSLMKGDAAVGLYSAAYRLGIDALSFIPMAFTTALFPVLSQLHISRQDSLKFAYQKSVKYLLLVGLPIAVGTTLVSDRIIVGIYSGGFSGAEVALQILIWGTPFNFLNWLLVTMLISIDKQNLITRVVFLSMVLNVIGNLMLIPRYSYAGASIATVVTGVIGCALYLHFVSRLVYRIEFHKLIVKPAIACGVMAGSLILLRHLNLFLVVPLVAIIYLGILFVAKYISSEDIALLKQALTTR